MPPIDPNSDVPPPVRWLVELTQLPTAAGREGRVVEWLSRWVGERADLMLERDAAGNLVVLARRRWGKGGGAGFAPGAEGPVFITAHLDHPAFVVERVVSPGTLELSFRGGVMEVFFEGAPIVVHTRGGGAIGAMLIGPAPASSPAGKHYLCELAGAATQVRVGDVATWSLPPAEIDSAGVLHTSACDDLAGAAAALGAMEALREVCAAKGPEAVLDVRLLFTRAEEIGFVGAIAACKLGTMAKGSRVIALENSRAFADSPVGAGPIVRVGDRLSIFTPWLTNACAKKAEQITGAPAQLLASQTAAAAGVGGVGKWQRKLMPGGACEASVYCAYGYDATCLCLPLGNYHNMAHLAELQAGTYDRAALGPPRAAREYIAVADYLGLVNLLVALGQDLPREDPVLERVEKLYAEKGYVLGADD
jgi:putative aminopeptidase FrvX